MFEVVLSVLLAAVLLIAMVMAFRNTRSSSFNALLLVAATILGIVLGAIISVPIGKLPDPYGNILPIIVTFIVTLTTMSLIMSHRREIAGFWRNFRMNRSHITNPLPTQGAIRPAILVDTSVIIDGRIADIARAGFVPGKLLVPRFVLAELQNIADSSDAMRRGRGRRGLEMLNNIRATEGVDMEVIEDDVPEVKEVDAKLVRLARQMGTNILTTDYNLNRVAQIEGVRVLNINELSNAIRPVVLPGEQMMVKVVQAGKEKGQGVGYLADGTMIVVDQGDKMIGQEVLTEITRVFQTVAGKMLFAAPVDAPKKNNGGGGNGGGKRQARHDRQDRQDQKPRSTGQTQNQKPIAKPAGKTTQINSNVGGGNKSRKRKSPTQRLEDSLVEMTGGA
jgi:uncharacterized protein YacL